ncbi:TonB-dependent receptor [uncultured Bacteroides sp.]|uniref:SusC/RagA family TonB-linked outer membrane protein n=1 Tax=uncultured Bacteroides sp. TaxID=162156 RepID=UPI002AA904CE|nr:TonB-dependent receptor [uncultured Bacteroides sp.]
MNQKRKIEKLNNSMYAKKFAFACLLGLFLIPAPVHVMAGAANTKEVNQKNTVTGKVLDENGEPIIGATVSIVGKTAGTITDLDGIFKIGAKPTDLLKISFVGYVTQQVKVTSGDMVVQLKQNAQQLEEVVVVGYGTQKSKNVTGSIKQVSAKEFQDLPVSNLAEALAGQINGLSVSGGSGRPGESATLSIRQPFNFSKDGGNTVPLVIIDDVIQIDPETGLSTLDQFNLLDASEIESVSVLRDASAAIYGSRASQGAIIVKTKRGSQSAPRISYSGKFGYNDAISHPKTLNAYQYGVWANSILKAAKQYSTPQDITTKLFSDNELNEMKGLNYDWLDEAWSSATSMSHSLNVDGGGDKATYFAGATYYDQGANLGKQSYDKWTFRAGIDVKLSSDLKFSASLSGNQGKQIKSFTKNASSVDAYGGKAGEQGDYNLLLHMPQYIPWTVKLDDGNEYYTSPALAPNQASGNATSANQVGGWNYFSLLNNGSGQTTKDFSTQANFSMTYTVPFVKGLSFKGTYATSRASSDTEQVQMPFTLALNKNMQNAEKHLYSTHTTVSDYEIKFNNKSSRVVYSDEIAENRQMNFYVNYDRSFGQHNITGMLSAERTDASFTKKFYLYDTPNVPYLGTSTSAGILNAGNSYTSKSESGTLSYLGRFTYSYADRYMAEFMFRSDASTKFAPENYWGFFPGVSLGWVASEESWFKDKLPWFEYLKVRASWGQTGKDNIKAWGWMQTYDYAADKGLQFGTNGGTLGNALTPGKTPNRNVHWDNTNKFNLGFDTRFLDGRLSANVDLYYNMNTDVLNQYMAQVDGTPITVGGSYAEENFGRIDDYGTEISFNWRDKVGQVKYNVGVDLSFNGNEIKEWPTLSAAYPSSNTAKVGSSTYLPAWGYRVWRGTSTGDGLLRNQDDIDKYWAYLTENATAAGTTPKFFKSTDKSQLRPGMLAYQDLHGASDANGNLAAPNGQINDTGEDLDKLCKVNKTYGFTTKMGASWKSLSWSAMISTSWGGLRTIDNYKINTSSSQMLWSPESYWSNMFDETSNPNGKYPNAGYADANVLSTSDFWTISTFRCYVKNMSIGYTLPKRWLKVAKIESAKLSLTGTNLWDFYNPYPKKYRNMYDSSTGTYPTLRTYSLGVSLSF